MTSTLVFESQFSNPNNNCIHTAQHRYGLVGMGKWGLSGQQEINTEYDNNVYVGGGLTVTPFLFIYINQHLFPEGRGDSPVALLCFEAPIPISFHRCAAFSTQRAFQNTSQTRAFNFFIIQATEGSPVGERMFHDRPLQVRHVGNNLVKNQKHCYSRNRGQRSSVSSVRSEFSLTCG